MKKNPTCQSQLSLNDIWKNVFFMLSRTVIENDNKQNFFIVKELDDFYKITRASNLINKWMCMFDPDISCKFNKIKDKRGNDTKEFQAYVSALVSGHMVYKEEGNAFRRSNLRYEELLNYLNINGKKVIIQEIAFLRKLIVNSCTLMVYLNEKTQNGYLADQAKVKKSELNKFNDRFNLEKIDKLARNFLSKYYIINDEMDVFELLAVIILRTLVEVSVDNLSDKKINNSDSIQTLQNGFIRIIEEYLDETRNSNQLKIDVSQIKKWDEKFSFFRETLLAQHNYSKSSRFIISLNKYYLSIAEQIIKSINSDSQKISLIEIREFMNKLKAEIEELQKCQETLENNRKISENLPTLKELDNENRLNEFMEQEVSRRLKLNRE